VIVVQARRRQLWLVDHFDDHVPVSGESAKRLSTSDDLPIDWSVQSPLAAGDHWQ